MLATSKKIFRKLSGRLNLLVYYFFIYQFLSFVPFDLAHDANLGYNSSILLPSFWGSFNVLVNCPISSLAGMLLSLIHI